MKQKEEKVASEVQTKDVKWRVQVPIQLIFEFIGKEEDRNATVTSVLEAVQLVTKFKLAKLGEPLFEELE